MGRDRNERRKYEDDVYYDVWRAGGNPDAIRLERVDVAFDAGLYHDEAAREELLRQRRRRTEEQ
jgi:hypothetical protein